MGWRIVKARVLQALRDGSYVHEARGAIDQKNLLAVGEVTAEDVRSIIERCTGDHHSATPHHRDASVTVHVVRRSGWYIKFYFVDPDTVFISVHR